MILDFIYDLCHRVENCRCRRFPIFIFGDLATLVRRGFLDSLAIHWQFIKKSLASNRFKPWFLYVSLWFFSCLTRLRDLRALVPAFPHRQGDLLVRSCSFPRLQHHCQGGSPRKTRGAADFSGLFKEKKTQWGFPKSWG